MIFSPRNLIIAAACLIGAVIMFTKLRKETPVSIPVGILLALTSIYIVLREFVQGFANNQAVSWTAKGILVVFLIYMLLSYNNVRAEQNAEFDEPGGTDEVQSSEDSENNTEK